MRQEGVGDHAQHAEHYLTALQLVPAPPEATPPPTQQTLHPPWLARELDVARGEADPDLAQLARVQDRDLKVEQQLLPGNGAVGLCVSLCVCVFVVCFVAGVERRAASGCMTDGRARRETPAARHRQRCMQAFCPRRCALREISMAHASVYTPG